MLILVAAVLTTVIYLNIKTITVVVDGKETKIVTFKKTLDKALAEKNIAVGPKDKVQPALTSKIKNKEQVSIKRAVNIKVAVDSEELNILSAEDNVGSMLKVEGISTDADDKVSVSRDEKLSDGMAIEVVRVDTRELVDTTPVAFSTVVKSDSDLPNTQRKIVQDGVQGEKKTTFSVTYENGKEVLRKVLSEIVSKKPTDKIIVQGTCPTIAVSRGSDPIPYKKVIKVRATAYSPTGGAISAWTASGRKAARNSSGYSTIAVDPSVIPYGTKVYVQGYGLAVAADTGSAIVGNTIDVFFNTYQEAVNWAVKYVNVYVLK